MYSAGVTGHDVTPFHINFSTSTLISCSPLALKVAKQKENVNFLEDYKCENQKKVVFSHPTPFQATPLT